MFIFELLTLEKTIYGYHLLEHAKYIYIYIYFFFEYAKYLFLIAPF